MKLAIVFDFIVCGPMNTSPRYPNILIPIKKGKHSFPLPLAIPESILRLRNVIHRVIKLRMKNRQTLL